VVGSTWMRGGASAHRSPNALAGIARLAVAEQPSWRKCILIAKRLCSTRAPNRCLRIIKGEAARSFRSRLRTS
jgi:hypothetical protein